MVFSDLVIFFSSSDFPFVTSRYVFSIALADIVRIESIVISIDSRSNVESFHVIRYPEKKVNEYRNRSMNLCNRQQWNNREEWTLFVGTMQFHLLDFFSRYSSQFSYRLHGLIFHSLLFTWSRCVVRIFDVVDIYLEIDKDHTMCVLVVVCL